MNMNNTKIKAAFLKIFGILLIAAFSISACSPGRDSSGTKNVSAHSEVSFLPSSIDTPTAGRAPAMEDVASREFHSDPYVPPASDPAIKKLEKKWGIRIVGVRQASAGYMLDFRFKVIDPVKAAPLLARENKPYLVDEATGATFAVPVTAKVGPLRQDTLKPTPNRIYYTFFANPGKHVKTGNLVTIVIGDFKAEHLVVE